MKRFLGMLIVAAFVALLVVPPALAGPFDQIPDGWILGNVTKAISAGSASHDTLWFTWANPAGGLDAAWFGPKTIVYEQKQAGRPVQETKRCEGLIVASKVPFRIRLFNAGGNVTGATMVPVDTVTVARGTGRLSHEYPCRFVSLCMPDSMRIYTAANDTAWVGLLYRRP